VAHLCEVVERETVLLRSSDARLFAVALTPERLLGYTASADAAEMLDAFAARFGRLQDTVGDKLLPALLAWLGHPPAPVMDNLLLAEKWGWLANAIDWVTLRRLRNQMVHEYLPDTQVLCDALIAAHEAVPTLLDAAQRMLGEVRRRQAGA
jgi:hypothetical protein